MSRRCCCGNSGACNCSAAEVSFAPTGDNPSTDVQGAIETTDTRLTTAEGYLPTAPLTQGSVLFADSNGRIAQDNANLFWNDTTNSLVLGSTTPLATGGLTVYGAASQKTAVFRANATTPGNVIEAQSSAAAIAFRVVATGQAFVGVSDDITLDAVNKKIQVVNGSDSMTIDSGLGRLLISKAGVNTILDGDDGLTLPAGRNLIFDTVTGTKIGTVGGAAGQKLAFWNSTPIVQPVLATGVAATVDNVITVLQNLGLCRQS